MVDPGTGENTGNAARTAGFYAERDCIIRIKIRKQQEDMDMKIILLEDVKALGKKGDMVEVNAGYARNFILPKKLGVEATGKNINDLKLQKAHQDKVAAEQLAAAQALAADLAEKTVEVKMKVGEGGKTFGAISTKEIAAAAKEQLGMELDKKKISVDEPIRSLGVNNVKIKLHPKVTASLKVKVSEM